MDNIKKMAEYCLNCKIKPCSEKGCPMHTEIPNFIMEVKKENYGRAYEILIENNICSHICSIVCPQEEQCEGSCVRGINGNPTEIGKLEKFVNEWAKENNYEYKINKKDSNGKKVAIIGSGPAGIECAYELLKEGYLVDIYEKEIVPGGILTYGIPSFRLPKDIVENVVTILSKLGANFILEKKLGENIFLNEISQIYDYVFLGIGATKPITYQLSDEKLESVYKSNQFLKDFYENCSNKDLGTVAVIGGGNVAMDCARTAVKMGAKKVKILYRRDKAHMPAREVELEDAISDGVEFHELTRVISANSKTIEDENGNTIRKIESLNCIRTQIIDEKAVDIEGDTFVEEANTVIFAIGSKPDKDLIIEQGLEVNEYGYIKVDENGKTSISNVYAGGDVENNKATVCRALAAGKRAAKAIIGK